MKPNPLFSILIANFNNGKYLQEAIESVKSQSYANWEIIIVDDGSTDNSPEIYKNYSEVNRIKIYYNGENKGCGYTKRRCTELATGELCGFLDPDDTLMTDALEVMVNAHTKNQNVALICSRHTICNENLVIQWISSERDKSNLDYLTERFHSVEVFASFKTEKYKKSVGINLLLKRAVDQDLYYLLEEQGEIVFIDNVLYNYRLHNSNLSIGHFKALYWHMLAMKNAAERRNLEPESVVNEFFKKIFDKKEKENKKLIESNYYKLGYFILNPIDRLKKKIRKWQSKATK